MQAPDQITNRHAADVMLGCVYLIASLHTSDLQAVVMQSLNRLAQQHL